MRILSGILHQHEFPDDKPVKGRGNTFAALHFVEKIRSIFDLSLKETADFGMSLT